MASISNKQLAEQVKARLDGLALSHPLVEQEARRVLNLGIPLAEMISAGMATATPEGRDHLISTGMTLAAMLDVADNDPVYSAPRTIMLDNGRELASWLPLWDAASDSEPRGYRLADDVVTECRETDACLCAECMARKFASA
jgi:hypothetical protein